MPYRSFPVPEGLVGLRTDAAISKILGLSRATVATLADEGQIKMNGNVVDKATKLIADGWLEVEVPEPRFFSEVDLESEPRVELPVVFEDEDLILIDKPAGVAAHPSVGWTGPTVLGALHTAGYRISTSGVPERRGIVHRLDVGTSGLMMVAKTEVAYSALKRAFKQRQVEKIYHSLVQGHPDPIRGTIDAPIGRHPGAEYKFAVLSSGKASITHYEVLEMHSSASLVEVHLETGRTHQIRVHFSALKHPCVGDLTYGADPVLAARVNLERQWLHAVRLAFQHPVSGKQMEFESNYPAELESALNKIRFA